MFFVKGTVPQLCPQITVQCVKSLGFGFNGVVKHHTLRLKIIGIIADFIIILIYPCFQYKEIGKEKQS